MTCVGVHMMSTGTSWINSFSTGISSTNCWSCTDVTIGVESSMAPMYRSMPYSSSANPLNRKRRAPVLGSTATEPITIKSTLIFSSSPIGLPYLATPAEVQASLIDRDLTYEIRVQRKTLS
nr:hypothetical protein Iba_chr01aCG20610 [Ipomoea batatas]GMC54585.1 hypothetical protein Iba_chr01dCG17500 [Ipomoea batatas]